MTPTESKRIQALKRFGKVLAAGLVAAAIGWASGPDAINVVGKEYAVMLTLVLIPALSALQKVLTEQ